MQTSETVSGDTTWRMSANDSTGARVNSSYTALTYELPSLLSLLHLTQITLCTNDTECNAADGWHSSEVASHKSKFKPSWFRLQLYQDKTACWQALVDRCEGMQVILC